MEDIKKIPVLRFPEFSGEWEIKKLGDISEKVGSGSTPSGGEKVYQTYGIPFIRSQNVLKNKLNLDRTHISEEINIKMKGSIVKPNDILLNITGGGSIGRSCVVPHTFTIGNVNQHVCIIRLNKLNNSGFIQVFLSSYEGQKLIYQGQTGSGREGLNFQSIRLFKIFIPQFNEQQKIADFLTRIDIRIDRLSKKKNLLESYKKGVMQNIFSQELRFKDEDGNNYPEWEEKKLGDFCLKKSSNISANSLSDNEGEYKIYGATGLIKKIDFYKESDSYISIFKDGAGVGRVILCEKKSSVLGTLYILKTKNNNSINFLYIVLQRIFFLKYIVGSTIPHIYFKDFSLEKIKLPSIKEQIRIADFLTEIDNKINLVEKQLTDSKKYKKSLLQKMFI